MQAQDPLHFLPPAQSADSEIHLQRYKRFVWTRLFRQIKDTDKTEVHHIVPRSFNILGKVHNNWNTIRLTTREHMIAHLLLFRAYGGHMATAYHSMISLRGKHLKNTRGYERAKQEAKLAIRATQLGHKQSPETIQKRVSKCDYVSIAEKGVATRKNLPLSEKQLAHIEKMKEENRAKRGIPISEEICAKMRKPKRDTSKMGRYVRTKESVAKCIESQKKTRMLLTEEQKEIRRQKASLVFSGDKNPAFGKVWVTNGTHNRRIDKGQSPDDGWWFGLTKKESEAHDKGAENLEDGA